MQKAAATVTKIVNKLIADGYVFNVGTMQGCQCESFKADLVKRNETIRVVILEDLSCSKVFVKVLKYDNGFEVNGRALWMDEGKEVYSKCWKDQLFYNEIVESK